MCNLIEERNKTLKGLNIMKNHLDIVMGVKGEYSNDGCSLIYDFKGDVLVTYSIIDRTIYSHWSDKNNDEETDDIEGESLSDFLKYYIPLRRQAEELLPLKDIHYSNQDICDSLKNLWDEVHSLK